MDGVTPVIEQPTGVTLATVGLIWTHVRTPQRAIQRAYWEDGGYVMIFAGKTGTL